MKTTSMGVGLLLSISGCGGAPATPDAPDEDRDADVSDGPADATVPREAGFLPDAARPRADDDGNIGFDTAQVVTVGGPVVTGSFVGVGDRDFLRFEVAAGQWIAVQFRAPPGSPSEGGLTLPLFALFDSDRSPQATQLGARHDGCGSEPEPGWAEVATRVARAGTHYLEVGLRDLSGSTRGGGEWSVRVLDLATSPNSLIASETGMPRVTAAHRCVLTAFETASDTDVLALELPPFRLLSAVPYTRHGATGGAESFEVRSEDVLVGRGGTLGQLLDPSFPEPRLRLRGRGSIGDNDHAIVLVRPPAFYGPDAFFVEAEEARNDVFEMAEAMPRVPAPDAEGRPAPFVTRLPEGDVDHFSFEVSGPASLELFCNAGEVIGSGVDDLAMSLLDEDGVERQRAVARGSGLTISTTLEAGRHILRMSAAGRSPEVRSDLVLCQVYLSDGGRM